jgi:hypothetical protein
VPDRPLNADPLFSPAMPPQPQNFFVGFALAAGWVALVIGVSIVYRRSKGKPLFRPEFERPSFLETWRSGHSLRSVITRLGGAHSCLWVAVNESSLFIGPHFPFNLMFLPEIYGLEFAVPASAIRSVERVDGLLARNRVRVSVERQIGEEESFEVTLRDPDAFVRAVEAIRRAK